MRKCEDDPGREPSDPLNESPSRTFLGLPFELSMGERREASDATVPSSCRFIILCGRGAVLPPIVSPLPTPAAAAAAAPLSNGNRLRRRGSSPWSSATVCINCLASLWIPWMEEEVEVEREDGVPASLLRSPSASCSRRSNSAVVLPISERSLALGVGMGRTAAAAGSTITSSSSTAAAAWGGEW